MKIMLAGGDNYLRAIIEEVKANSESVTFFLHTDFEPLKILSDFLTVQPAILIIDDDHFSPNTFSILDSICRFNKKTRIIFTTSSTSIELGKKVSQLGIFYYAIKPINENEIVEILGTIINSNGKHKLQKSEGES